MVHTKDLVLASLGVGRALWPPRAAPRLDAQTGKPATHAVPIRSLGPNHRARIAAHLLALDGHDRYFRFGYAATDEQIQRYADGLDFERDEIFGIYNRKLELLAMAHLAYPGVKMPPQIQAQDLLPGLLPDPRGQADAAGEGCFESCAEFGVSVSKTARGRGYGGRLFERAAMHARNDGVALMFIHALSENTVMLQIARKAGATLHQLGSESEAYLRLDKPTFDSRMTEILDEQIAQADYRLKFQAKLFWAFLTQLQDLRQGVADAIVGPPGEGRSPPW